MRRDVDAQCLPSDFRNQGAHILDGELRTPGGRDPERRFLRVFPEQYRTVFFDIAIDDFGHGLWNSPLIATTGLRLLKLYDQPPVPANFLDRLADPQRGEVFISERVQGQKRDHQAVADTSSPPHGR